MPGPGRLVLAVCLIAGAGIAAPAAQGDLRAEGRERIRLAVERLCPIAELTGRRAVAAFPGSSLRAERHRPNVTAPRRTLIRLALPGARAMEIERWQSGQHLRRFTVSYHAAGPDGDVPVLFAIADGDCRIRQGRAIRAEGPAWRHLDLLDSDLTTIGGSETLQAPWPDGRDPGGVRVALVDAGLAYDLPLFRDALARDADGTPLGYDFWDMDPWPYDGDTARGPFLPMRHGTAVASILVREAPNVALIPFRYPRPDMTRMADIVDAAARAGARILVLPLGSRNADDWETFARALSRHDMLAIVSAGNDGRDIDRTPVYPAALDLDTVLTVTSSDTEGRLARGSNWGRVAVDIMLPGENIAVVDHLGRTGQASGSSFAVPRVAAMAARLLEAEPQLSARETKRRILDRAKRVPSADDAPVATGWIADPLSR